MPDTNYLDYSAYKLVAPQSQATVNAWHQLLDYSAYKLVAAQSQAAVNAWHQAIGL